MASIFISHSSADNAAARAISDWLKSEDQGYESLFLDFDPDDGIKGGENWKNALRDDLARCQTAILLLSDNWLR